MSDYDLTERRIIDGKKIQYSSGGSRKQRSIRNENMVSKVGVVTDAERHAAASPFIPVSNHPNYMRYMLENGLKQLPPGTKFCDEFDENGMWTDAWGRKWSWDSAVMPGDTIEITNHEDDVIVGHRAIVKNVRQREAGVVSATMLAGNEGCKYVLNADQYVVVYRRVFEPIAQDDYLAKDLTRKDIVREDL